MKIEIEQEPKVFNPRLLKITFEIQEEFDMFNNMMAYDISIPEAVYYGHTEHKMREKLSRMMRAIRSELLRQ